MTEPSSPDIERCPTCKRTDDGYILEMLDCRDPWHGDDHLRRKSAARSSAETKEPMCEITNALLIPVAMSPAPVTGTESSSSSTAPVTTLPESVRIPLNSLQADLGYLIGRVVADGSCGPIIVQSMRERLNLIESGFRALAQPSEQQRIDDAKRITSAVLNVMSKGGDNLAIYEAVRGSLVTSTQRQGE